MSGAYRLPWTRQTFNLVPSMIVQVDEYARGEARDPFLACALKRGQDLTPGESNAFFAPQDFRDLQVLSQVAWFDEEFQSTIRLSGH